VREDYISGFAFDASGNRWVRRPAPYNIGDAENPFDANDKFATNFIAPFILDPNNQQRILAGGASLWVTNDARAATSVGSGPTWKQLKGPLQGNPNYISAIAVAKGDSNVIWIGHNNSDIYVTRNGMNANPSWVRVDLALPSRVITRIVIDPAKHDHVYALMG